MESATKHELHLSPIVKASRWAVLGSMLLGACQEAKPTVSPDPATPTNVPVTETITPTPSPTVEIPLESLKLGAGGVSYTGTVAAELLPTEGQPAAIAAQANQLLQEAGITPEEAKEQGIEIKAFKYGANGEKTGVVVVKVDTEGKTLYYL
jgi:hypothetical protein